MATGSTPSCYEVYYLDPQAGYRIVTEKLSSAADVIQRVAEIRAQCSPLLDEPYGVGVANQFEENFDIGFADEGCVVVLSRMEGAMLGEQLRSQGDETASGSLGFYLPTWTDIPRTWLVPCEHAMQALSTWLRNRGLDPVVMWNPGSY